MAPPPPPPPPLLPRSSCVCSGVVTHTSLHKGSRRSNKTTPNGITPAAAQLSLLRAHARAGRMRSAREVFDAMPAPRRSLVAWTALMSGYATHGLASEALELLLCMLGLLLRPDAFVFSVALRACAAVGSLRLGRQLHGAVSKLGYVAADLFVANGLVTMYATCRSLGCAEKVFGGIPAPDLVSWTSMLSAYTENGCHAEALMLFMGMVHDGIAWDAFILSVALRAASSLGHVGLGHQLHCCMIKMGLVGNEFLDNCLIGFLREVR